MASFGARWRVGSRLRIAGAIGALVLFASAGSAVALANGAAVSSAGSGALVAMPPVTVSGPIPSLAPCQLDGDDNTPLIVSDPTNPAHLTVSYLTGDARASVVARSVDGGQSWSRAVLSGLTTCTGGPDGQVVDPDLAIAPDGTVLASNGWVASNPPPGARNHDGIREFVSRSSDEVTWPAPVDLEPAQPDQRGAIATDTSGHAWAETERAPYLAPAGYTYVEPSQVAVVPSSDDGETWGAPATVATSAPAHDVLAQGLQRLSDGSLVAFYLDIDLSKAVVPLADLFTGLGSPPVTGTLHAVRSTDGGHTWPSDTSVVTCGNCFLPDTTVAPDGSLLLMYYDAQSDGSADVGLARSSDGGATWTTSRVTHAPFGAGLAAVAARPGQIGVLVTENTDSAGDVVELLYTSTNDGADWKPLQLAGPYQMSSLTNPHFDGTLGPEEGLTSLRDGFGAVFTAFAPQPVADGQQDVVYVHVVDPAS